MLILVRNLAPHLRPWGPVKLFGGCGYAVLQKVDDKHPLNWSDVSFYAVHVDLHDAKCVKELGQELEQCSQ